MGQDISRVHLSTPMSARQRVKIQELLKYDHERTQNGLQHYIDLLKANPSWHYELSGFAKDKIMKQWQHSKISEGLIHEVSHKHYDFELSAPRLFVAALTRSLQQSTNDAVILFWLGIGDRSAYAMATSLLGQLLYQTAPTKAVMQDIDPQSLPKLDVVVDLLRRCLLAVLQHQDVFCISEDEWPHACGAVHKMVEGLLQHRGEHNLKVLVAKSMETQY